MILVPNIHSFQINDMRISEGGIYIYRLGSIRRYVDDKYIVSYRS